MSNVTYTPTAILPDYDMVNTQVKNIQNGESAEQIIQSWLDVCFAHTKKAITLPEFAITDYKSVIQFLYIYRGSLDTFKSYRRDLERLFQWSWFIKKKSCILHLREDIEAFIEFCQKPPKRWISLKNVSRFKASSDTEHTIKPNSDWRPFTAHVSKVDHSEGKIPEKARYKYSQAALKVLFGILSSYYSYLVQEQITSSNPLELIRQKSKFLQKQLKIQEIRRLSNYQWETVISFVKQQAEQDIRQERTLFILSCRFRVY